MRILICVPTCRRPNMLKGCLSAIAALRLPADTEARVLVIDNGGDGAGRKVVDELAPAYPFALRCLEESRRGICMARNRALEGALEEGADYIAFLDDDEEPHGGWLEQLWLARARYAAAIVTGPVIPVNVEDPVPAAPVSDGKRKSGESPRYVSCNNVLFDARLVTDQDLRFDPFFNFIGGEDFDFFERARAGARDSTTVWCAEALVFERTPKERRSIRYLLFRHYTGGINAVLRLRRSHGLGYAWRRLFPKSIGKLCGGIVLLPLGLLGCRRCRSESAKRLAVALGYLSALCGVVVQRYRTTDGN